VTQLRGLRPGDRRVRIERATPQELTVAPPRRVRPLPPPGLVLVAGFVAAIALGTMLLVLPFASVDGRWTDPLTALFTATSAVCVTGLVVVDTASHWSTAGQLVILVLIQAGGFGIMTSSTLLLFLLVRGRTRLRDRVLVQESIGTPQLGDVMAVVRRVAVFTLVAELVGAAVLAVAFAVGRDTTGLIESAWWGLFHAVSAFNNAGFDLTGGFRSLAPFADDWIVLGVVGGLIILGGLGFAIVADATSKRRWARLGLESKVVLVTSTILLVGGAVTIAVLEWTNPETLGALPEPARMLNATFESISLRTAGFSSMNVNAYVDGTLFIVMALMFVGGAAGSTAGGIKVSTFSTLFIAVTSTARGRPSAEAFGRRIPHIVVYRALAVSLLAVAFVFVVGLVLTITSELRFVEVLFEAVSAFGTNGTTTGITRELGPLSLLVVIVTMFVGRLGPLTVVLILAAAARPTRYRPAVELIRIG
jgi:trk system potassium uptake protein TrkH